jgi:hypothetical protein
LNPGAHPELIGLAGLVARTALVELLQGEPTRRLNVLAHQPLREFAVAVTDCLEDRLVLDQSTQSF